jgi:hypothetical protein
MLYLFQIPIEKSPSFPNQIFWNDNNYGITTLLRIRIKVVLSMFDSAVPFPVPLSTYISCVLQPEAMSNADDSFQRKYRMIPRIEFLEKFSSDRSHMLHENGDYNATPPRDDPIRNGPDNLQELISMERGCGVGRVFDERELLDYLDVE